jgi:hypothetical protein
VYRWSFDERIIPLTNATLSYLALHFRETVSNCVVYAKKRGGKSLLFLFQIYAKNAKILTFREKGL